MRSPELGSAAAKTEKAVALARTFAWRFAEKCDRSRFRVTLLDSRARGDAEEESDVDLCVEVADQDSDGTARRATWDIVLREADDFADVEAGLVRADGFHV